MSHTHREALLRQLTAQVAAVDGLPGVYVRQLTVADVEASDPAAFDQAGSEQQRIARAACAYICTEHGDPVFSPANPDDVAAVARMGWTHIKKILKAGDALNGDIAKNV